MLLKGREGGAMELQSVQADEVHQIWREAAGSHDTKDEGAKSNKQRGSEKKRVQRDRKFGLQGETALHKAAFHRYRTICRFLIDAGASLMQTDFEGNTPRHKAQEAGDLELAAYLENRQHYQVVAREDLETAV
ncbi:hypothetical protein scyTo_0006160 [Scyliorhinus torazame]|uniref:Uncharacterized protein n=1 Tax=Scyliorhinus torazame TaxID=75743 RepID=A0A401PG17_SCYTO|nr:hypothetical protein [Scyliorhinus torazame]